MPGRADQRQCVSVAGQDRDNAEWLWL